MIELKQLFTQTLIYGFSSVIARILNFFLVPLYTILFMPSEYAIIAEMYAYAALLMVIGSFGMETTFFRFTKEKWKHQDSTQSLKKVFSSAFIFLLLNAIILMLTGLVFYKDISILINHPNHPEYVLYFIFIICFDLVSVIPFALLREKNQPIKFALIKTINIIINIFFNLFFLLFCPYLFKEGVLPKLITIIYKADISVGYVFISNLIASVFTLFLLFSLIRKHITKPDYRVFKKMIHYAWPILIAGLAFIINETVDKILIKYLLPKGIAMRELGIYSACYKLTIFMTLFVQAYRFAAEPFFFHQFKKPNPKKIYALMMDAFVLFSSLVFLFVVLYLDVIKLIIPNQLYHEGIVIVPIVLMANIFLGIYYNLSVWYKVTNQTKYAAIISGIGALITIGLNTLLIPRHGYVGAAWTTLICYFSMSVISLYLGRNSFKINYNIRGALKCFFIVFMFLFLSIQFDTSLYKNIQIDNTIIFVLYLIFIYRHIKKLITQQKHENLTI